MQGGVNNSIRRSQARMPLLNNTARLEDNNISLAEILNPWEAKYFFLTDLPKNTLLSYENTIRKHSQEK